MRRESYHDARASPGDGTVRVTVVHNPDAGDDALSADELRALLTGAGHRPDYRSTKEKTWKEALEDPGDLVVAAGGDGTIAKIARRIAGRGVPMAILPAGTANNIARTLGLCRDARTLIGDWPRARVTPVDLGIVDGPMGERLFMEAVGIGVIPRLVAEGERRIDSDDTPGREQIARGIALMHGLVATALPTRCTIRVDELTLSGDYLAVEVMNIRSIGPRIELAPDADPRDGWLDVVIVRETEREELMHLLASSAPGDAPSAGFTRVRARCVELSWDGRLAHIDADIWPEDGDTVHGGPEQEPPTMRARVLSGAVEVLM